MPLYRQAGLFLAGLLKPVGVLSVVGQWRRTQNNGGCLPPTAYGPGPANGGIRDLGRKAEQYRVPDGLRGVRTGLEYTRRTQAVMGDRILGRVRLGDEPATVSATVKKVGPRDHEEVCGNGSD